MPDSLDSARLLAVIETQNEIAATALDSDAVMQFVTDRARELTRASASAIEVPEDDEMVYRVGTGAVADQVGLRLRRDSSLSGRCVIEQRVLHCEDALTDPRVDREAAAALGIRSMICVPLRHKGEIAGVLKVMAPAPRAFAAGDVTVLGLLSGVVAAHLAHATNFEVVQRQSRQDALTGLGNRRAFEEDLAAAIRLAIRRRRALALALFDVDRFKAVNDRHGHPAGDAVLVRIAQVLAAGRAGDKAYRLGGDEFALVMPETALDGATIVAERVRRALEAGAGDGVRVTTSAGLAERSQSGGADELVAAADEALYAAKAQRRRGSFT